MTVGSRNDGWGGNGIGGNRGGFATRPYDFGLVVVSGVRGLDAVGARPYGAARAAVVESCTRIISSSVMQPYCWFPAAVISTN